MGHALIAAGQMKGETGAHEGPAQPRPIDDRIVNLVGAGHAIGHHVQGLAPDRLLQAIGDIALDLAAHPQRLHTEAPIEGDGAIDGPGVAGLATQHLHQGQQVDRIEGMADHHPPRHTAVRLNAARQQSRGTGGDDHLWRRRGIDALVQGALQVLALGRGLLDEIRLAHGLFQIHLEA